MWEHGLRANKGLGWLVGSHFGDTVIPYRLYGEFVIKRWGIPNSPNPGEEGKQKDLLILVREVINSKVPAPEALLAEFANLWQLLNPLSADVSQDPGWLIAALNRSLMSVLFVAGLSTGPSGPLHPQNPRHDS